jgi:phosphoglycolate phosphatase
MTGNSSDTRSDHAKASLMPSRVLITDLDNTLYDWVTFFAHAFDAMVRELSQILSIERRVLLTEFREIHQRHGSTETPWAALELPSARRKFPHGSTSDLAQHLDPAFKAFSAERKRHLILYDNVARTLECLANNDVAIIGHTEALPINAFYRLTLLEIINLFTRLYTMEGGTIDHPFPERLRTFPPPHLIRTLPLSERKPNPDVLLDICRREGVDPQECLYVGDSLTRDVAMSKEAGVRAVWARYGTHYDPVLWGSIVEVTHWTSADVHRESKLKEAFRNVTPDFIVDRFDELLPLFGLPLVMERCSSDSRSAGSRSRERATTR